MKPGRRLVAALCAVVVLALAAGSVQGAANRTVRIKDIDFHPARVVIHRGDRVTWRFQDPEVTHNVTSVGKPHFHSSPSRMTGTYSIRFTRQGTYRYVCTLHPGMAGRVVVR